MNNAYRRLDTANRVFPCIPGCIAVVLLSLTPHDLHAQSPANGTTVFRCIDISGVVSFADAPCKHSASTRLRIEHSLVQSAPISMAEQQRLRALEQRLNASRVQRRSINLAEHKRKLATAQAGEERCRQAKLGFAEIRARKRRGYPARQSKRIDNEEAALRGEISTWCTD